MKSANTYTNLIEQIFTQQEPVWAALKPHYDKLNDILKSNGESVEGNIYAYHGDTQFIPEANFLKKRHTYALFAAANNNIVEIGFNAGHSALLALITNPTLHYTAVDIGEHTYTQPCFDYLQSIFGERVNIIVGDSRQIMPVFYDHKPHLKGEVDSWIIDGGHGLDVALQDVENVVNLSRPGDNLLFDDTDWGGLVWLLKFYELQGVLTPTTTLPASHGHLFYKINK